MKLQKVNIRKTGITAHVYPVHQTIYEYVRISRCSALYLCLWKLEMKRFCLIGICLFASMTSVGCFYHPAAIDPMTGLAYGGVWEPVCGGPLDPLGLWCWVSGGGVYAPWNHYGGYPGVVGPNNIYGNSPYNTSGFSPYMSYPPGAIIEDPCGGCGNVIPTFQGTLQGPVEYTYPPSVPPTEREDAKGKEESAMKTHFQTSWRTTNNESGKVVAH